MRICFNKWLFIKVRKKCWQFKQLCKTSAVIIKDSNLIWMFLVESKNCKRMSRRKVDDEKLDNNLKENIITLILEAALN